MNCCIGIWNVLSKMWTSRHWLLFHSFIIECILVIKIVLRVMLNSTSLHVDVCLHVLWVGVWVKILNALQITGPQNDRGPENVSLAVQRC